MIDYLKRYASLKTARFHMPGHKGKSSLNELIYLTPEMDITEIDGSDNLHNPEGIIMESQKRAAKLFGARESIYLVNGSTSGIYSAITGTVAPGEKMLVQRNSHSSAYNALVIGNIDAEYIYPEYSQELGMTLGIRPEQLEKKLDENPDISTVFLTSPSYYGICLDLESIAEIVHRRNGILIVDEAHGSHLCFSEALPKSALESGVDIVIQSTHKTLLGLTQTAMLHIGSSRVEPDRIKKMAKIYQSTSPSYMLMSSLDHTVTYMKDSGKMEFEKYMDRLKEARENIAGTSGVKLISEFDIAQRGFGFDSTKLIFRAEGFSGKDVESSLRGSGVELEMSDLYYGVALSSFMDSEEDFKRLKSALAEMKVDSEVKEETGHKFEPMVPEKRLNLRDSFYMDKESKLLDEAVGKVSGDMVIPYPPGIPLVVPGEVIDRETFSYIKRLKRNGHVVQGIEDGKIDVIRED